MAPGYINIEEMTGIYIVCSDKNLLDNVNRMFKRRGMIGVTDTAGRVRYIVDGRQSKWAAMKSISNFLNLAGFKEINMIDGKANDAIYNEVIGKVLNRYGFEPAHIGTKAVFILIKQMIINSVDTRNITVKEFYSIVGERLQLTYGQTERDVRYAIKNSQAYERGVKSITLVKKLADEVRMILDRMVDAGEL